MNKVVLLKRAKKLNMLLNEILINESNNPKLNNFSITEVKLTTDGQIANVYVSVLGSDLKKEAILKNLEHSKGYLRSKVAPNWSGYRVPQFRFHYDETFESAFKIDSILNNLTYTTSPDEDEEE